MKKAFTLAEVMIVLTVIGVLTAILLPVARQSMPDENLMKFKKAHNTLLTIIRELTNSDKYYLDGDLGIRADGTLIDGTHENDKIYFCETIKQVVNYKKGICSDKSLNSNKGAIRIPCIENNMASKQTLIDEYCQSATEPWDEIVTTDNILIYQTDPNLTFGMMQRELSKAYCFDADGNLYPDAAGCDEVDFDIYANIRAFLGTPSCGVSPRYKIFCLDIDGLNVGEAPFGYAIKADGKVVLGAKAQEWLERDINEE